MVQNFLVDIIRNGYNQPNNGKFKCSHSKHGIFCANCGLQMILFEQIKPCQGIPLVCDNEWCRKYRRCLSKEIQK